MPTNTFRRPASSFDISSRGIDAAKAKKNFRTTEAERRQREPVNPYREFDIELPADTITYFTDIEDIGDSFGRMFWSHIRRRR